MYSREKLIRLFDGLNDHDKKRVLEFIESLAHGDTETNEEVLNLFGKKYYVIPD